MVTPRVHNKTPDFASRKHLERVDEAIRAVDHLDVQLYAYAVRLFRQRCALVAACRDTLHAREQQENEK